MVQNYDNERNLLHVQMTDRRNFNLRLIYYLVTSQGGREISHPEVSGQKFLSRELRLDVKLPTLIESKCMDVTLNPYLTNSIVTNIPKVWIYTASCFNSTS